MWKCHKCGKPVYFAERKQSLGYDWHPECLRCEECGKRLNPGQHAEHKGVPYCHVPCYGALFGPQLFGHGTRVESHKSFGQQKDLKFGVNGPVLPRSLLDSKLKVYNQFYDGKSGEIRSREVNGRLILEGSLRIHWGIQGVIHLKENDDQRTVVTIRKRNSCRISNYLELDSDEEVQNILNDDSINDISAPVVDNNVITQDTENEINTSSGASPKSSPESPNKEFDLLPKSVTLPSNLNVKNLEWDELDELLQVERKIEDSDKVYQTMPTPLPSQYNCASIDQSKDVQNESVVEKLEDLNKNNKIDSEVGNDSIIKNLTKDDYWMQNSNHLNRSMSGPDCLGRIRDVHSPEFDDISIISNDISVRSENLEEIYMHKPAKTGSSAIKRRPGKRRSRTKIKRRCSINGHFYDRETSFFTPPHGSQMSVWVTSLVNTQEVINLMLEKYKVDSDPNNFALFIVRDNGEQKRLKDDEYPLLVRVLLGPHEDVVRLFLMDSHSTPEVSCEVAQFLNLSLVECRAILNQYYAQEEREVTNIIEKFQETKRRIKQRMEELKVRL